MIDKELVLTIREIVQEAIADAMPKKKRPNGEQSNSLFSWRRNKGHWEIVWKRGVLSGDPAQPLMGTATTEDEARDRAARWEFAVIRYREMAAGGART